MSPWLARARAARAHVGFDCAGACANCAKCAKTPFVDMSAGGFGTNGTIGTASGVPADEIRARFAWIAHRLVEEHGRDPLRASEDARAILKSELLNDLRLSPVQHDAHRCFICSGIERPGQGLVPVLTAKPDTPLWLHLEPCHGEHRRQRSHQVDELLHSALGLNRTRVGRAEEIMLGGAGAKL